MSGGNEITEGEYNSDNYDVTNREADGYYAGLDKETSQRESEQTQSDAGSQKHQRRIAVKRDSILNKVSFVSIDKDGNIVDDSITSQFITSQGEVYGLVDKDGNIYLDEKNSISKRDMSPNVCWGTCCDSFKIEGCKC